MARDFRVYWSGEVTSTFGSVCTATAVSVVAVQTLKVSAEQVGVLTAAGMLPTLIFGLLSGAMADGLRRPRRVLMLCEGIAAAAVAAVAAGLWQGWASVWWFVALNFVLGSLSTLVDPLYFTHLSGLVDREELVRGRARLQSGEYGAGILGRSAAGPLVAAAGGVAGLLTGARIAGGYPAWAGHSNLHCAGEARRDNSTDVRALSVERARFAQA